MPGCLTGSFDARLSFLLREERLDARARDKGFALDELSLVPSVTPAELTANERKRCEI
jgi:hypothetical protein